MSEKHSLNSGQSIRVEGENWSMRARIGSQKVVVQRDDPNAPPRIFTVDEVAEAMRKGQLGGPAAQAVPEARDLDDISEKEWEIATSRHRTVVDLLAMPNRSRVDVEAAGRLANVNASTVYDWMKTFQTRGYVTDLVPSRPGPKNGSKRLDDKVERIIEQQIEAVFLNKKPMPISQVQLAIAMACKKAELPCPAPNTVRARIQKLNPEHTLIRQNRGERARNKFRPIRAHFPDEGTAMAVVQIDHTRANIIVVDEVHRLPIDRPWITLAIDVHSRIICGVYISFDAPSSVGVAMCMINMALDKREYLARFEVPGEWPVHGKPGRVLTDNAKEFRSKAFEDACKEHSIDLTFRPRGQPNWGGHIERLMKTSSDIINTMPGTTYSNPGQRAESDPMATAALTLREFETLMADWIVNIYNARIHSQIDCSPVYAFKRSVLGSDDAPGTGVQEVQNEEKFRLDFLPSHKRGIDRHGVVIDYVFYWDEVLKSKVVEGFNIIDGAARARPTRPKYTFRYDPRDMSVIHFWDPDARLYFKIPYRDMARPAISAFEIRKAKAEGKALGVANIDEAWIFEAVDRMRKRTEEAVEKSKSARKDAAKRQTTKAIVSQRLATEQARHETDTATGDPKAALPRLWPAKDDLFARPVRPFDVAGDLAAKPQEPRR